MKICYLIPSLAKKGPNNVVADLVSVLYKKHEISVFYFNEFEGDKIELPCETKKISLKDINCLKYFDIVHSHMLKPDLFVFICKVLSYFKFGKKNNYKSTTTLHQIDVINLSYDYKSKLVGHGISYLWRLMLSLHDSCICINEQMLKYYKKRLLVKEILCIYNGRSFSSVNEKYKLSLKNDRIKLVTCCLLTERKGLDQVIRVLPSLPNVEFIIIGDGPEKKQLENLARKFNCSSRVIFKGFVSNPQKELLDSDAFILPSRGEGFPLSLLEAASLSLPCISSNLDMLVDAFDPSEISFFKLENLDSLERAIHNCLGNLNSYSKNINDKYNNLFTKEIMSENYNNHYLDLLEKN
ncbi:glycosyltransferase family 4 protein [Vibrio crassostreae]|uniref:glycosyltransferase family 4 protein n=1 Tax=Vibrio crassostreae TaxID=246167 RepID=UPI0002E4A081|nr:glycosyltransferase family 4 protein [Vibrio crassostreae]OEE90363.1 hypothetical protein A140_03355 [Vibrio crassostreae 9ZC88]